MAGTFVARETGRPKSGVNASWQVSLPPAQAQEKGTAMIDEQNEVRRINWNEVFSFTHIFKGFKMAIQPSKMLLALAVIVLIYVWGAWVLDTVWGWGDGRVAPAGAIKDLPDGRGEIACHITMRGPEFEAAVKEWREARHRKAAELRQNMEAEVNTLDQFTALLGSMPGSHFRAALDEKIRAERKVVEPIKIDDLIKSRSIGQLLNDAPWHLEIALEKAQRLVNAAWGEVENRVKSDQAVKDTDKDKAIAASAENRQKAILTLTAMRAGMRQETETIGGQPIFASLMDYERDCIVNAVRAVRYGNITGGLARYRAMLVRRGVQTENDLVVRAEAAAAAGSLQVPPGNVQPPEQCGLIYWKLMALHGLLWLVQEHWLYATLLGVFSLAVWALFGGALYRVAALHAAREEKISFAQALKFAGSKFFSFFCAPLVPAIIILGVGLLMSLVALAFGNIPWIGSILIGLPFVLAIVGGMIIAFITVGLVGGGALMYPTIAVEGSDSFDAISRSFSYIFARPWRAILYALVMTFYGVITFLFVRLFAWVALAATHCFVKLGIVTGGQTLAANADKLDILWPAPTMERLAGEPNWAAMTSSGDKIGAVLIWFWVALFAAATLAYLISFCASGTTIIYYLLRRKVDATDLDDVYVEEAEEPAGGVSEQPAPATPSAETPAPPAGPAATEPPKPPEAGEEKKE